MKLESFENFKSKNLSESEMSTVKGGFYPVTKTTSGTVCISTQQSASGCMGYSGDTIHSNGVTSYAFTGDVDIDSTQF